MNIYSPHNSGLASNNKSYHNPSQYDNIEEQSTSKAHKENLIKEVLLRLKEVKIMEEEK